MTNKQQNPTWYKQNNTILINSRTWQIPTGYEVQTNTQNVATWNSLVKQSNESFKNLVGNKPNSREEKTNY